MTDKKGNSPSDRLIDIARELEKQFGDDDSLVVKSPAGDEVTGDNLNESERRELTRIEGALVFLNQVRGNINRQDLKDSAKAVSDSTQTDLDEPPTLQTPTPDSFDQISQIGRFEILRVLGQGGFARVFLARDPRLDRLVALKVPRPAALFAVESQARFDREARAAAVLSHPGIVPVFESGAIGPIHYIASGYCAGQTLGNWLGSRNQKVCLRLAARIVAQLANAVHHAHQRGIIHRDIKPGNILLKTGADKEMDADRLVDALRITDFGLAKDQLSDDHTLTHEGAIVGTPVYMSPEQARGDKNIDATTDVYSLGVILYELLVGRLPHEGQNHVATLRAVEHDEPAGLRRSRREIPRDLEAICLKALSKSKTGRYATAFALADDLQNWLDDRPIKARNITATQRLGRWVKRNPALAGALGFGFLSLTIGLIATNWQWRKSLENLAGAQQQNERAERHLGRIESNLDYLVHDLAISLKDVPGMDTLRRKILRQVIDVQKDLIAEESEHPLVQSRTVQAYMRLAKLQGLLGKAVESEQSIEEAMMLIRDADPASEHFDFLQVNHVELLVQKSQMCFDANQHSQAIPLLQEAAELASGLQADEFPGETLMLRIQVARMSGIGFEKANLFDKAEEAYKQALAVEFDPSAGHSNQLKQLVGDTLNSMAILMKRTGRIELAQRYYVDAAIVLNELREQEPHRPDYQYSCAIVEYNLGNLFFTENQYAKAEPRYLSALDAFTVLRTINPKHKQYSIHCLATTGIYAATLARLGRFDEASDHFRAAIDHAQTLPPGVAVNTHLLRARNNLARMQHEDMGKPELAEQTLLAVVDECKTLMERIPGDLVLQKSLAVAYANLTQIHMDRQDWHGATELANKHFETIWPAYRKNPLSRDFQRKTVQALNNLARIAVRCQQLDQAIEYAEQIAAIDNSLSDRNYRSARCFAWIVFELESIRDQPDKSDTLDINADQMDRQIEMVKSRALQQLKTAIENGFQNRAAIESQDDAWVPLRGTPEFLAIINSIQ